MSYVWAKTLGAFLCVLFLVTLRPLLRRAAAFVPPALQPAFLQEIKDLSDTTHVPKTVLWALLAGIAVWIGSGVMLSDLIGDASVWVGGAAGLLILYPYFFLIIYQRARSAAAQPLPGRRH
jgi:hypothetical protein